jgi:CheY-like chemotaxis protein
MYLKPYRPEAPGIVPVAGEVRENRASQGDKEVVAEAANGEEALEMCNRHFSDVLLLDLRMPRKDGWQVMTELAARNVVLCRVFTNVKIRAITKIKRLRFSQSGSRTTLNRKSQLVLIGMSLGGYFAPRAAAFEERIDGVVA